MEHYCYRLYSSSKSYGSTPRFIRDGVCPTAGFASIYKVTEDTAQAIYETGTTKAFKGAVWSEVLWVDVDSYDAAAAVETRLINMGLEFRSYDSGGKGAHFAIVRHHSPSHLLPAKDKQWVRDNIPEADISVYTHLHPFRLEGTVHEETGRVKEELNYFPGAPLILPNLREKQYKPVERINGRSVFDCFLVMLNSMPAKPGERHSQLVKLTYALKDDAELDLDSALWWVMQVNKRFTEPKDEKEVEALVGGIYR